MIAGVDGCRAGWVVATDDDGALGCLVVPTFSDVLALVSGMVAVDIPIGLPDAGPRTCDVAARRALGPRRASVFPAPVRSALNARTHAEASEARRRADGKGMSIQAFHLLPKIREVDACLRGDPARARRVVEVHPEVSFAWMNGRRGLAHAKKRLAGRAERIALLVRAFGGAPERFLRVHPRRVAAPDDVLDAFAALWTARRLQAGTAEPLLPDAPRDACGLPMAFRV